ncbi:MAG: NAD(P)H-binding protein [Paracoccaceae bacterium]|nr:NAD(P)H-binding protein [Paracoccaceae bacterium]MDG2257098.1 NAD(P)H-binding protein [Paracoccaceae bacterium]
MDSKLEIALLGATGQVGKLYLKRVLDAGHTVRALVRDPSKIEPHENLTVLQGDATIADDVSSLVEGADLVVSCVGGSKGVYVMEATAKNVLAAVRGQDAPPKAILSRALDAMARHF